MKKKSKNSAKKKNTKPKPRSAEVKQKATTDKNPVAKSIAKPAATRTPPKKAAEKGKGKGGSIGQYIEKAAQFLRESKIELKKVKWPTRKELLATTGVVIVLTLFCALYLGLVDFGLIKLIRHIVG
jgi:preprotein translocase subunit SecE